MYHYSGKFDKLQDTIAEMAGDISGETQELLAIRVFLRYDKEKEARI